MQNFKYAYQWSDIPDYEPALSDRIDNRAARLGVAPEELAYDLLLEDEGRAVLIGFFGAAAEGTLTVAELICPRGSTGFTVAVRRATD